MSKIKTAIAIVFIGSILYFVSPTVGAGFVGFGLGFLISG